MAAPGEGIVTTFPGQNYVEATGTSFTAGGRGGGANCAGAGDHRLCGLERGRGECEGDQVVRCGAWAAGSVSGDSGGDEQTLRGSG